MQIKSKRQGLPGFLMGLIINLILLWGNIIPLKAQNNSVILGRPTDTSITVSIVFDQNVDFYLEYGTLAGIYTSTSNLFTNISNKPDEIDLYNLAPDTRYVYRIRYLPTGTTPYSATPEYSFHTQRSKGSTFSFTIEADEHLYDKKGVKSI